VAPCGLRVDNPLHYEAIKETALHLNARIIIIDALVAVHGSEEQDNKGMAYIMRGCFRRLMRDTGASILLLHHLSKPSDKNWGSFLHRARGASEIVNASDMALGVSSHRGGFSVLETCRNRFIAERDWPEKLKITLEDADSSTVVDARAETKLEDVITIITKHKLETLTVRATYDALAALGYKFSRATIGRAKAKIIP
jgi:hypothetical protein